MALPRIDPEMQSYVYGYDLFEAVSRTLLITGLNTAANRWNKSSICIRSRTAAILILECSATLVE